MRYPSVAGFEFGGDGRAGWLGNGDGGDRRVFPAIYVMSKYSESLKHYGGRTLTVTSNSTGTNLPIRVRNRAQIEPVDPSEVGRVAREQRNAFGDGSRGNKGIIGTCRRLTSSRSQ